MDKSQFLQVLQRYASTSVDEAQEIASLRAQYPYSQLLQTLAARSSKDHGLPHQQRDLQFAAVYAADRNLLKEIIITQQEEPAEVVVSKHVNANEQAISTIDSADVADVVMDDLERLSQLKHTFENLFMEFPKTIQDAGVEVSQTGSEEAPAPVLERYPEETTNPVAEKNSEEKTTPVGEKSAEQSITPVVGPETSGKSKKERIIEMAKALNDIPAAKKRRDKDGNPVDGLIVEIQNSKEELQPESESQKQQIEIINQFIRVQPSISNPRDRAPSAVADLNPVKSGEFGDNIVSETLVEILLKQGKKDKAIEVLKKLIWKYPQKKAYFASQIEDLKK